MYHGYISQKIVITRGFWGSFVSKDVDKPVLLNQTILSW